MDAAARLMDKEPGLLVVASQQTNGRGQRGRVWEDANRRTLPCTFSIGCAGIKPPRLAALVGCAVHETLRAFVPSSSQLLIKWPNDIVVREGNADRKAAGILIEQSRTTAHIGVGINCTQDASHWSEGIKSSAVSLSEIGAQVSRLDVVCNLIEHLSQWITFDDPCAIRSYYEIYDAMINTRRAFAFNNTRVEGVVERLDPLSTIEVRTRTGLCSLPIAQTSHIRDEPITDHQLRADA